MTEDAIVKALAGPLINYARSQIKNAEPINRTARILRDKLNSIKGDFLGVKGLITDFVVGYTNANEEYVKSIIREINEGLNDPDTH